MHRCLSKLQCHYSDVIMSAMASEITGVTIIYSTVCSGADQRKYLSSASLAFVRGIHRSPVNPPSQRASNAENVSIWWRHHRKLVTIMWKETVEIIDLTRVIVTSVGPIFMRLKLLFLQRRVSNAHQISIKSCLHFINLCIDNSFLLLFVITRFDIESSIHTVANMSL